MEKQRKIIRIIILCVVSAVVFAVLTALCVKFIPKVITTDKAGEPTSSISASSETVSAASSNESTVSSVPSVSSLASSSVASEPEPVEIKFSVTSPKSKEVTVNRSTFTVRGSGDPAEAVYLNGEELKTDKNGIFSKEITLKEGSNTLTFSHKGKKKTFKVKYERIIIKSVSPSGARSVESDDNLTVSCTALRDSSVTASFNGQTVSLYADDTEDTAEEYVTYVGSIKLPINNGKDKSYGKITFKAEGSSGTATKKSGAITVKTFDPEKFDGGNGYPKDSGYLNVGTTYIAEVIAEQGETYSVSDATALSRPTNNYLPKGTLDYCSPYIKQYQSSGKDIETVNLRFGNKMHKLNSRGAVDIKIYEGTLPETNKLSVVSYEDIGRHTLLTLNVDWKAPFKFSLAPQKYASTTESNRNYTFSEATYNYVDITFCYGEELNGLPDLTDDPLFSSCEVIKGEYDVTLRLYLKNTGEFYGWSAEYNEEGQLQFKFLKPATLVAAENEWGYSLEGIKIVVDAGHGGRDNGASGFNSEYTEDVLNLSLAIELEAQLKELGATVIMTRTDDTYIEIADRFSAVRDNDPNLVISVHRNAATREEPNSFISYHFNAYTKPVAESLLEASLASGVYKESAWSSVRWHVFFLSRVSDCPSVLTENGFMTNKQDYANMLDPECNKKAAAALCEGIIKYFIAQQ